VKKRRQEQIFEYVSLENAVSVARLSEIFRVSQMTIRRDLDELEKQGLIVRVPGGAMSGRGRTGRTHVQGAGISQRP